MQKIGGAAATATPSWEELLGSNNWSGQLYPLLPALREHILRCGSFLQIAGDSFIYDSQSKYLGKCRYSPDSILHHVFFKETADYVVGDVVPHVDGYLHTTIVLGLAHETNWMGYVAVSSDDLYKKTGRREIYVVWRGTERPLEWLEDIKFAPVPFGRHGGDVKIMQGWSDIYTTKIPLILIPSAQDHLRAVIKAYLNKYKDQNPSIICVGHSLGGALAIVSAFDIASEGLAKIDGKDIQVCAVAFDAPKVGNQAFNDALEKLPKTKVLRINNTMDIVTYWPLCVGYVDTGTILHINSEESIFLKSKKDYGGDHVLAKIAQRHALQVILHTVTGWSTDHFDNDSYEVKKRLPLVNRSAGHLKAEHKVIEAWWADKNHGMVYNWKEDKWYERAVPYGGLLVEPTGDDGAAD